jgi:hypothetical protein
MTPGDSKNDSAIQREAGRVGTSIAEARRMREWAALPSSSENQEQLEVLQIRCSDAVETGSENCGISIHIGSGGHHR